MRGLGDHLTSKAVTKSYTNAGDIDSLTPTQRWAWDETGASGLLDAAIPDNVQSNVQRGQEQEQVIRSKGAAEETLWGVEGTRYGSIV